MMFKPIVLLYYALLGTTIAIDQKLQQQKSLEVLGDEDDHQALAHHMPSRELSPSIETYAYVAYYSDSECSEFAGMRALVSGDQFQTPQTGSSTSCSAAMACLLQPDSPSCESLELTLSVTKATIDVREGGKEVYECDSSNVAEGNPECSVIDQKACIASSTYANCHFHWRSATNFYQDSEDLVVPADLPLSGTENYAYLAYYSDSECSKIAGVRGFVSEEPFQLVQIGADVSCEAAMACVFQPNGPTCQELDLTGTIANLTIEVRAGGNEVYECDTTNVDVGEPECAIIDQQECKASSIIPNCHFIWRSAVNFVKNPSDLVPLKQDMPTSGGHSSTSKLVGILFLLGVLLLEQYL